MHAGHEESSVEGGGHLKTEGSLSHVPVLARVLQSEPGEAGCKPSSHGGCDDAVRVVDVERDLSSAQIGHDSVNTVLREVTLTLAVQKTDTKGLTCSRTLRCACRIAKQTMCPYHSMRRHLQRSANLGPSALSSRAPLFPGTGGHTKAEVIQATRATLKAEGLRCGDHAGGSGSRV